MKYIILLFVLFFSFSAFCQAVVDESGIRGNAVAINDFNSFDTSIAGIFETQKLILAGEIHGTAEPAEFVNYLVANLVGRGRRIYVGLEISPQDIGNDVNLGDSAVLSKCAFFKEETFGKASVAWLHLITRMAKLNGVGLFFFDITKQQAAGGAQYRDSLMYENIKAKMLGDTGAVYICLSGNFHNKLTGDRFPTPMGNYLLLDKELNLSLFNMVSFNQEYVEGAGYFNTGGGTQFHPLQNSDYLYTLTGMPNYFLYAHSLIDGDYNGLLFTHHVTPSRGLR